MHVVYAVTGVVVYLLIALDLIKTTFSSNGGGIITQGVSRAVWRAFFAAAGGKGRSRLLQYAGPAVLVCILMVWVLGLWTGFFLLLLSDPNAVQKSSTLVAASSLEKFYYAGFTLSTLGVGDFVATTDFWRVCTSVAAFSGLAFITASITYFVPVLSAVGLQSKLSLYISGMGSTPQQVLANSWTGEDFSPFTENVSDLCQMLLQHTMNHRSYPVIHYFHNSNPKLSVIPAVVLLDEVRHLFGSAVPQHHKPAALQLNMLHAALHTYLQMVRQDYMKGAVAQASAPAPDLEPLRSRGIPVDPAASKEYISESVRKHRQQLTVLLEQDGWNWENIYAPDEG